MNTLEVSFAVKSTDDTVNQIAGNGYTDTTVSTLVAGNPQFWLESDTNGNTHLCTTKTDQGPLDAGFTNSSGVYSLRAQNFEVLELVGGRPIRRPHAY